MTASKYSEHFITIKIFDAKLLNLLMVHMILGDV